jgi:hypothetical protein
MTIKEDTSLPVDIDYMEWQNSGVWDISAE